MNMTQTARLRKDSFPQTGGIFMRSLSLPMEALW